MAARRGHGTGSRDGGSSQRLRSLPPGSLCFLVERCLCLGQERRARGRFQPRRVSLTSCLGFVQGFEPLALLIICFLLSHVSGPSLELVAGMSPACPGEHVSQLQRREEGLWGSPLCHVSAQVALTQECLAGHIRALPVTTTATERSLPASHPSWRTRQKEKDLRVMLGSAPQDPPARVGMC